MTVILFLFERPMKTCFKCNRSLLRSEFYAHPQMGDGLLGKCKDCTKADVKVRITVVQQDPVWRATERARCRLKEENRRLAGLASPSKQSTRRQWRLANPHKHKAHNAASNAVRCGKLIPAKNCEDCGQMSKLQKHHEDYSKPLDVDWLCTKCHGIRHRKDRNLQPMSLPKWAM